jgi:RimJ/RimL family protein N-acetyltransferase
MIDLMQFQPVHIDEVVQLSRRLESDPIPTSYWGLDSSSASELLQNSNKHSLVALLDKTVVGIGTLARGEQYQYHLAEISIAVDPGHRKNGLARKIVQQLEQTARELQIEMLKVMISTHNIPSRRLFEALHYEHRATLYAEFKSEEFGEIDDCVYYKRLVQGS